jgi:5-methylcytosine-specific restriction protein A
MTKLTGFTPLVRQLIKERAGIEGDFVRCEKCQFWTQTGEIHHRRPRGAGGSKASDTNKPSNGVWLCRQCHLWVETRRETALEQGWLVPQGGTPSTTLLLRQGIPCLLDDFGGVHDLSVPFGEEPA